ncbi:hypothetical protein [Lysobacter sp. Root690]|uniref:hypothetical protein n=1 Tax=Lysobacter sp. Root690 TaxID=1736588 RepID=UPI0006F60C81|nr:hypothetical protein [Lysobacter sp. Root690]KRB08634.1 hypothetical protein ASD86_04720 [Lysobacter sp. Root690]
MSFKRFAWLILGSLLAMSAAVVALVSVNLIGGTLASWLGFPPGGTGRLAWDLAWAIAGGTAAIATATYCAPAAPRRHALVCFAALSIAAVYAVAQLGGDFPSWFCAGLLLSLPLQGWLGMKWALKLKSPTIPPARPRYPRQDNA